MLSYDKQYFVNIIPHLEDRLCMLGEKAKNVVVIW
jgi:hypothetical protein